ncbi:MAG: hypothetical protein HZC26_01035 [Candidatus Magasanikbacteria bacterium]|nr:hypothetical protein [Candidatus Magasanikbacteria bacterium]
MTNRDQGDEVKKDWQEAQFSSDFSKVPAEAGKDAGILKPIDIRHLGEQRGLRTETRAAGKLEAQVSFFDTDAQHIEIGGVAKENGKTSGSWEYSYLQRPDGKLETAGCTISVGGKVEKFERHFNQQGQVTSETDKVGGKMREEVVFDRDQQGRVNKARGFVYDENGIKREESVFEVGDGGYDGKATIIYFDESGNEARRNEHKLKGRIVPNADVTYSTQFQPLNLEVDDGIYDSSLEIAQNHHKKFERV